MLHAFVVWAVVGLIAGWLASLIMGGRGFLRYAVVGMIGSVVGGYLFGFLGIELPIQGLWVREVLKALIGAIIVIVVARIVV